MWASIRSDESNFVDSYEEGVKKVKDAKGGYAFLLDASAADFVASNDCDLAVYGGFLDSKVFGIATLHDSPIRTLLNSAILQLQETQKMQSLYHKWWHSEKICAASYLCY